MSRCQITSDARRRATVYLDPDLHRALRIKAAETDKSISDLVNDAVRQNLAEDADDLAAYRARAKEPKIDLQKVLKDLRRRGKL
jgi:plasmid stability protein